MIRSATGPSIFSSSDARGYGCVLPEVLVLPLVGAVGRTIAPPSGAQYGFPFWSKATLYPLRHVMSSALERFGAAVFEVDGAVDASEQAAINTPAANRASSFFTASSTDLPGR